MAHASRPTNLKEGVPALSGQLLSSDWAAHMSPRSRQQLLNGLRRMSAVCRAGGDECPFGFTRCAHQAGEEVCAQYRAPDLAVLTDETLVTAYRCAACDKSMFEHETIDMTPQLLQKPRRPLPPHGT